MRTLALLFLLTTACGASAPEGTEVSVAALHEARVANSDIVLIDVRTPEEYAAGHVPGAKNIPMGTVDAAAFAGEKEVYVICQSGGRSSRVTGELREAGVNAINVAGGTGAWKGAGYAVE